MSLVASKATAVASRRGPTPRSCTAVSSSPAMTCALSPRAVARDPARALDAQAAGRAQDPHDAAGRRSRPPDRARSPRAAPARRPSGPSMCGNGSKRASALRIEPDGGSTALRRCRISERWMSRRSSRTPGVCSATAPTIHARPSAIAALSSAPSKPSSVRTPGIGTLRRSRNPALSNSPAKIDAAGDRADQRRPAARTATTSRPTAARDRGGFRGTRRREARQRERARHDPAATRWWPSRP